MKHLSCVVFKSAIVVIYLRVCSVHRKSVQSARTVLLLIFTLVWPRESCGGTILFPLAEEIFRRSPQFLSSYMVQFLPHSASLYYFQIHVCLSMMQWMINLANKDHDPFTESDFMMFSFLWLLYVIHVWVSHQAISKKCIKALMTNNKNKSWHKTAFWSKLLCLISNSPRKGNYKIHIGSQLRTDNPCLPSEFQAE